MAGRTKYHMTPAGLMRCRHGQGGVSGKPRACPYGGPVTSSSERMGLPKAERVPVVSPSPQGKVVSKQEPEPPAFAPLPKDQAVNFLKKEADRGLTEADLEEWLNRDNRKQVAALEAAAQVVDEDLDLAISLLKDGGVWVAGSGHYSETTMDYTRFDAVLHGDLSGGYETTYSGAVSADSIRRSIAHHKRTDRTTLYTALDADASTATEGDAIFYAVLAKNELEAISADKRAAAEAKEEARKAAPIDWHKVSLKQMRSDMGKTYDETNPKHVEFAQALEEIGSHRDKFWHPDPRFAWRDSTKNALIEKVKQAKQAQAAKAAPPVDLKKASIQKIMDSLGPKFDATLPLHQEVKAKLEALTPRRAEGYRVAPEHQASHGTVARSSHVWWVQDKTPIQLTEAEADSLHRAEVAEELRDLFTSFKGDRRDAIAAFKKRLAESGL